MPVSRHLMLYHFRNVSSILLLLSVFSALLFSLAMATEDSNSSTTTTLSKKQRKNETVEALKQQLQLLNASQLPHEMQPRESTFSMTYVPVFLIVVALIIIIGLYVYDVFNDMKEEGGLYRWTNDTISLHCSDTTTNQFRFLLCASVLFSTGLIWLLAWESKARTRDTENTVWYSCDVLAAICFACIGIFPTHGDTTRHQVGKVVRDHTSEETGCIRCSTIVVYRSVVPNDYLMLCGRETCISRNVSKWIHLVTSLYAMIELTTSNMFWSFLTLKSDDDHHLLFRGLSSFTLFTLIMLFAIQGSIRFCKTDPKAKAVLYLASMAAELFTLLFAVITTMSAILHRDHKVLWIFSTCVGIKT